MVRTLAPYWAKTVLKLPEPVRYHSLLTDLCVLGERFQVCLGSSQCNKMQNTPKDIQVLIPEGYERYLMLQKELCRCDYI